MRLKSYVLAKINKLLNDVNWATAYSIAAYEANYETFHSMKGCNKAKKIVLCGSGPSLEKYEPFDNVLHVALNRALLFEKVKFDWLIVNDWIAIDMVKDEVEKYDCVKFFGKHAGEIRRQIPEYYIRKCGAHVYYSDTYAIKDGFQSRFVTDIDMLPLGNMPNIALQAMQILLFTEPDEIYLVGVDASLGHFDDRKFPKDRKKSFAKDGKLYVSGDKAIAKWHELKKFASAMYPDTKIISVNPVGLKGIFSDVYQSEAVMKNIT